MDLVTELLDDDADVVTKQMEWTHRMPFLLATTTMGATFACCKRVSFGNGEKPRDRVRNFVQSYMVEPGSARLHFSLVPPDVQRYHGIWKQRLNIGSWFAKQRIKVKQLVEGEVRLGLRWSHSTLARTHVVSESHLGRRVRRIARQQHVPPPSLRNVLFGCSVTGGSERRQNQTGRARCDGYRLNTPGTCEHGPSFPQRLAVVTC